MTDSRSIGHIYIGFKKLHCKGEPNRFSGQRDPSQQTKSLLLNIIGLQIHIHWVGIAIKIQLTEPTNTVFLMSSYDTRKVDLHNSLVPDFCCFVGIHPYLSPISPKKQNSAKVNR